MMSYSMNWERRLNGTELEIMVATRLGECCRPVEAEEISNSRNKTHQTMNKVVQEKSPN